MSWSSWVFYGACFLIGYLIYYLLSKQKVLDSFEVRLMTIEPASLVYTVYRGDYQQVMSTIESIKADLRDYCADHPDEPKRSSDDFSFCGIYYDNPQTLIDPKHSRALVGILSRDDFDAAAFLRFKNKRLAYHQINMGRLQAFGAEFSLLGLPSLLSSVIRGYPAIRQWGMDKGLLNRILCSMEIYEWGLERLRICFLYGKTSEALMGLSGHPQPAIKSDIPKKVIKRR